MSHRRPPDDPSFDRPREDTDPDDDGFDDLPTRSTDHDLGAPIPDDEDEERGSHLPPAPVRPESGQHLATDDETSPDRGARPEAKPDPDESEADREPEPDPDPVPGDDVDLSDFERMQSVDHYVAATTQEYRGLAEEIDKANEEEHEHQAVAATMAGLESGIIGFDDVTGEISRSGEEVEREAQEKASDLTLRVGSAVILVGLFLGSLAVGGWAFAAFLISVMVLALGEFYATVRRGGYRPLALFGLLGVIGAGVGGEVAGPFAIAAAVVLTVIATVLFYTLTGRRLATENMTVTVLGAAWVSLFAFGISIADAPNPFATVFFVAVVTAGFDIGGYFVGRSVGSRPMSPRISPSKTLEGYLGGVVAALVLAAILSTFPFNEEIGFVGAILFALVVAVLAPLGDLAESVIKRSLGVKDMGSVLPGHGGMLDRIDSFLFVVPGAYVFFHLIELV